MEWHVCLCSTNKQMMQVTQKNRQNLECERSIGLGGKISFQFFPKKKTKTRNPALHIYDRFFPTKEEFSKAFFLQNRNVALVSAYSVKQSYLLGAAQHMTLRPGDALLQDPALLLSARDQEVTIISRQSIKR